MYNFLANLLAKLLAAIMEDIFLQMFWRNKTSIVADYRLKPTLVVKYNFFLCRMGSWKILNFVEAMV